RIGLLLGGKQKTCLTCQLSSFTKQYAIKCLYLYYHLNIYYLTTDDLISFILNKLP
ncbi:hypothetical protein BDA99DRAFT_448662, partial [Phascolomyces articulosus]